MSENLVLERWKREALYAQCSLSTELLYQTYGKAKTEQGGSHDREGYFKVFIFIGQEAVHHNVIRIQLETGVCP